ncbi:site-specific DNA-methyltransferase [Paenibacillus kobensis]|uniref:site-specific DNA-methyltransferase n=1 Tax=Paenibacillus kobensis TaxID=59841 RepID=UPI000FD6E98C|nr:DNA methyltransferase [Paenibacillus kobensis]
MAAINDLIMQIQDSALRAKIEQEVEKLSKQKKFGLVFEEHLPECTPLYDVPVRKGGTVAIKTGKVSETYVVLKINGETATCFPKGDGDVVELPVAELVTVAEFGEPVYPYLKPLDTVCNAPDSDLWHTLIEADNYHALQLLEYLYAGKVDCIYIDPPYNTGAKDWKYNNDYVDSTDAYRHSKWLSMMQKRLKMAKKLLNPKESVLIVTIDEKEYLHLGCLLEELFPHAKMQMVSITINPSGAKRDNLFSRADEYAYIVLIGDAHVIHPKGVGDEQEVRWWYLRRTDFSSRRGTVKGGTAQFYPIYVDDTTKKIIKIGLPLTPEQSIKSAPSIEGATAVFPIREDGVEMNWGLTGDSLKTLIDDGVVRVTEGSENQPYVFRYLSANYKDKIHEGRWAVRGLRPDGTKIVVEVDGKVTRATTVWQNKLHDAGQYGTSLLGSFIGTGKFSFPKSLYAVQDTLRYFVASKKEALIVDFFAGSGTTLHAVNLLNAEDGGRRRCVLVTNNEVSADEATALSEQGFKPGDPEWDNLGIARNVTWPRTVCSIKGRDISGAPLEGDYGALIEDFVLNEEDTVVSKSTGKPISKKIYIKKKVQKLPKLAEIQRASGFETNAAFFKLGFLDRTSVALGRQFKEMLPTLWMKAGAHGPCPSADDEAVPIMLVLPENKFAILTEEAAFPEFEAAVNSLTQIETVYIVTDYETGYCAMAKNLRASNTYQLYRDYLDNFRINTGRN